ncbi:hypothetical protein BG004_006616 [Podila humilis]|nr:hypothetical protein BG004_006616 [Podila humilis]
MDTAHHHLQNIVQPPVLQRIDEHDLDYTHDPTRVLQNYIVRAQRPFNAEPTLPLLVSDYITPSEVFFKRNHGPIPDIQLEHHQVYIGVQKGDCTGVEWKALSMHDLMTKWPKATITASLQCAGNRRDGLAKVKEVKGVIWGAGTISNALWSGPRLCDILKDVANVPENLLNDMIRTSHVSFEADDHVKEDVCYGSSIPLRKAM